MERLEAIKQQKRQSGEIYGIFQNGFQINIEKRIKKEKDFGRYDRMIIVLNQIYLINYLY